ncbi:hypothetical protein ALC62_07703 [Cyphomyrmex costatus]|uniref:Uncharacterized protein n=1 Tax=Cyphomyrmex costatus TaxID=456900 RepID=A0A195CLC3_9HYME|nr:hypothetical protein ALC62_07703 [Cyphomyrmex costatus]
MDLSTTPRRAAESVGDLQKTRVAKSVFSIRSLVDVEETELPTQDDERPSIQGSVRMFSLNPQEETLEKRKIDHVTGISEETISYLFYQSRTTFRGLRNCGSRVYFFLTSAFCARDSAKTDRPYKSGGVN